ncbi:hypothetical protein [Helicobacter mastomyrinus]|uniref:Uncharacterized protein n=1 Tax=Helicobacter mastomyrinus TaxID=287948 RepID=A0ABZ3F8K0_9HELI|nr:hypothetical protein [uncultured Helicobacter sp.]
MGNRENAKALREAQGRLNTQIDERLSAFEKRIETLELQVSSLLSVEEEQESERDDLVEQKKSKGK